MKQVLVASGTARVEEVPAPIVEPGTVLVRVDHSCISIGTEMAGVRSSGMPLWQRALKQPDKVFRVLQTIKTRGLVATKNQIAEKVAEVSPTGYSVAGTIVEVGRGVTDLRVGDRVACAGAQSAFHAEVVRVPRNLVAPIPEKVSFEAASTVTLGAIALQGVRRAQPTLGETFVVVGLGILGQLTVQLLKANGCRVIGSDLDPDRLELARHWEMEAAVHLADGDDVEQVKRLTSGIGADGVIITAATPSHEVMSRAFRMCRKKGRVVLVGDVGLHLNRADFYTKELDFFISTSYGPGRYDPAYEEQGIDYPIGYVRWTENRNMAEFLQLIADGRVQTEPLVSATYPIARATEAYEALKDGSSKPLMILLSYPRYSEQAIARTVPNPAAKAAGPERIRLALVGAGSFAKGMHLPNLRALSDRYHLQAVMSRTGHNAQVTAHQYGAGYSTTEFQQVLSDPAVDAVLIATRHDQHAAMALEALKAGKHVLLEKPLALTYDQVKSFQVFYEAAPASPPILLTGFNRRFSAYAQRLQALIQGRSNPMILNYRMNAGYLPLDHWVHTAEGGGRNLGEACHIYDFFTFLTGSRVVSVSATPIRPTTGHYSPSDNFVATMSFEDGSVATLTYTALGSSDYPKEHFELYVDGKVAVLSDYCSLTIHGAKHKPLVTKSSEKGQREELEAFAKAIQTGGAWPIPLWQQLQATRIGLEVERLLHL